MKFDVFLDKPVTFRVDKLPQEVSGIVAVSELGEAWVKLLPLVQFSAEEKKTAVSIKTALHIVADDVRAVNELDIEKHGEK